MLYAGMPVILPGLAFMMYGETIISVFRQKSIIEVLKEDEKFAEQITEE